MLPVCHAGQQCRWTSYEVIHVLLLPTVVKAVLLSAKFSFSVSMIIHEPLHLVQWTCTLTTARHLLNIKVKVTWPDFQICHHCEMGQKSLPTRCCLHLAWWSFAWTCTLTTARIVLNFKVIGRRSRSRGFLCIFCVRDTDRQYLAIIWNKTSVTLLSLSQGFTCLHSVWLVASDFFHARGRCTFVAPVFI